MRRKLVRALGYLVLAGSTACAEASRPPAVAPMSPPADSAGDVMVSGLKSDQAMGPAYRSLEREESGLDVDEPAPITAEAQAPPPPPRPTVQHKSAPTAVLAGKKAEAADKGVSRGPREARGRGAADGQAGGGGEVATVRASMLVYTADITMAVFEVNASLSRIEALARDLGGFLARRTDNAITIRVPAQRFEDAIRRIEAVGDVLHRNVVAEDVTEEFRDLEVRIKNLRAVRERLTELLAKAVKVEESVLIEKELERVAMEIDRIEGRMKFLRDRAAFSTITVTFQAKPKENLGSGTVRLPGNWLYNLGLGRLLRL